MNNEKQSLEFVLEMRKRFNQPKFFIEFTEIFDNFLDSKAFIKENDEYTEPERVNIHRKTYARNP